MSIRDSIRKQHREVVSDVSSVKMARKLRDAPPPLPTQLEMFERDPHVKTIVELKQSPPSTVVGRILVTNCETAACQSCVVKFDVDSDDRDPSKPWPIGPMRFRLLVAADDGESRTCVWCGKTFRGKEQA